MILNNDTKNTNDHIVQLVAEILQLILVGAFYYKFLCATLYFVQFVVQSFSTTGYIRRFEPVS